MFEQKETFKKKRKVKKNLILDKQKDPTPWKTYHIFKQENAKLKSSSVLKKERSVLKFFQKKEVR